MNNIPKYGMHAKNISFSGHSKRLNNQGLDVHRFYYLYDSSRYDCDLELYNIKQDKKKNITVADKPSKTISMKDVPYVEEKISDIDDLNPDFGFAYRFKLTDKKTKEVSYAFDNGQVSGIFNTKPGNQYNIVLNNRATINKNGPMQLIMPDEYYPGIERNIDGSLYVANDLRTKAINAVRTHANRLGGGFKGITKRLQEGALKNEGIRRIVGNPFTKDSVSSHLYWTENAYMVAPSLGNDEDFKELQIELFKNGINWISDAALVNEGFGGIHMSEFLRKGQNSISKNMFRVESDVVSLGILPNEASSKGYTSMKLINAPFALDENGEYSDINPQYNPSMPTYIQFYDNRLASESQKVSGTSFDNRTDAEKEKLPQPPFDLTTYDKTNTDNVYDITKHYDAVYPFYIEVNPQELERNISQIYKENGKVNLSDIQTIKRVSSFTGFKVDNKSNAANLEFWDGNVDIAKLNFFPSTKDDARFSLLPRSMKEKAERDFKNGTLAVRDYAVNSGKYWTQLTSDIQLEYASRVLGGSTYPKTVEGYMAAIKNGVKNSQLPPFTLDVLNEEIIDNVLKDKYYLPRLYSLDARNEINPEDDYNDYSLQDYILKKAMDIPLETLPVATNLLGIITSPYIAKKPYNENEIAVSRYDMYKAGNPDLPSEYSSVYNKAEEMFVKSIEPAIEKILVNVLPDIQDDDGNVSEYGRYVISEAMPDIFKYIVIKALNNSANIEIKPDGTIDFTKVNANEITMQSIGIPYFGLTSEEEADSVLKSIKKGLKSDYPELKDAIKTRFENRTVEDFKIAEMIMDRTESGLGWRIDAAKDVASIDAVRSGNDSMISAWNNTIDIWKLFNQSVLKVNPHAYTTAELTDLAQLFSRDDNAKYTDDADAERKFLQETGITSVANYNYFFSLLPVLFQPDSIENGGTGDGWMTEQNKTLILRQKLDEGWAEDWKVKDNGEIKTNPGFLFESPDDGVVNSYTFVGNHDKPRVLHGLGLDMALFHSDFAPDKVSLYSKDTKGNFKTHRQIASEVLLKPVDDIDFDKVSAQAIAMGQRLNDALSQAIDEVSSGVDKQFLKSEIQVAISKLATGNFKDNNIENGRGFDALAFGTRPFDIAIKTVLDEVEYLRAQENNSNKTVEIDKNEREKLEAKALEKILVPAYDRYLSIYKLLTVLPGSPTDFAGDRTGTSGYETKCKNDYQQNRNTINWEWLDNPNYDFIHKIYEKINAIAQLRSSDKLSALNDGDTITLPIDNATSPSDYVQGMLRYNDKGSVVLTFTDNKGSETPLDKMMQRGTVLGSEKLYLLNNKNKVNQGLKHGIKEGMIFKNPLDAKGEKYTVKSDKDGYYLEKTDLAGKVLPIKIEPKDFNTLILYKV